MMLFQKCILIQQMPIYVFGSTSESKENKNDTSVFVQKPYWRTKKIEKNLQKDLTQRLNLELKVYLFLIALEKLLQKIR